ncbi:uncharacterized protein LOC131439385 [Malaya genurostris]|uniref:uncharacterized protein LOC131439385 n=1 Tax=Malaya genurostris TaxID=325434 RepID=UPI0026F3E7F9|nr:uncharacterized protein LOC131439385 [Malaya genurostris]
MNFGTLHWSYRDFRFMPEELRTCGPDVLEVYLKENFIPAIPDWFFQEMMRLRFICLAGNLLEDIPEQISLLVDLETLDVSQNTITLLPRSLGCLRNLTVLKLSENKLTSLPREIGLLANLEMLDVSNNRLNEIPVELSQCLNLKELIINENYLLVRIPNKIFTLPRLVYLSAEGCNLMLLPFAVNLNSLEVLRVFNNNLLTHYPLMLEKFIQPNYDPFTTVKLKRYRDAVYYREIRSDVLQRNLIFPGELTTILDRRKTTHNPSSLVENGLRKCYYQSKMSDLLSVLKCWLPRNLYRQLLHGPVAVCGNNPCSKNIFKECVLGLIKKQKLAKPAIFSILFCSKLCANLWFQCNCDVYDELNWTLV